MIGLGAVWLLVGLLVVPRVIEAAYRGTGFAWLHGLFADYPSHSLDFFLGQWRAMIGYGALGGVAFTAFAYVLLTPRFARRYVGKATPQALGAIRALVCSVLLTSVLWEDVPSTALLPRGLVGSMGVMALFHAIPGFSAFAASATALTAFKWGTALVLVLGMVGWRTRWVLPLGAACYLVLGGLMRQYAWFYHTGLVPLYLLAVLALTGASGDALSVDRLRRLWNDRAVRPADRPTRRHGWARYAVWTTFAMPYFAAGLSKLRNGGLLWWQPESFLHIILRNDVHPMEFNFDGALLLTHAPDALIAVIALSALLGELCYASVLFSRRARYVMPVVMTGMHVGILLIQNILFFDLILLQLLFFNVAPLRRKVVLWFAARWKRIRLAYDAGSAPQKRLTRVLRALDVFERIALDARRSRADAPPRWTATYDGETYRGVRLARLVARALPACWPLLPLLYVPGASRLLRGFFFEQRGRSGAAAHERIRRRAASPRLTLVLVALLTTCWVFRVELYPLTAMQMFSKKRGPVMTYDVTQAYLRNGEIIDTPIREGIGALADGRYRRLLGMAFDPKRKPLTRQVMRTFAHRWNRQTTPPRDITRIVVKRRKWDIRHARHDPDHGRTVARQVFPIVN